MAKIDLKQILNDSVALAKGELQNKWKSAEPFATHEFQQFAETAEFLTLLKISNQIDEDELKARIGFQKLALQNVLITIEGIGLITAQNIANGVLDIFKKAANAALGFALPF